MRQNPKIAILLATFNRAHLIEETLDSIIAQTYVNWECIIVDDYSIDNTAEIVEEYIQKDSRFSYYLKTKNYKKGLSGTRNYGLDIAQARRAEYIQFFDDDDIMHTRKLELQISPFLINDQLDFTVCQYLGFTELRDINFEFPTDIPIESKKLAVDFLFSRIRINSAGPLFKFKLFLNHRFDEELHYAEERELFLRIFFKEKPNYQAIKKSLFFYRNHPISITARKDKEAEKIGTNIVVLRKLWDFLSQNELLNKNVISFFLRNFLFQYRDKEYINKISLYISGTRELNFFQKIKLKTIIKFHAYYTKVIYKLLLF
ncbi:glycosyltransferase family 2 protein [Salinimicrobium sp. GXAS 041]|uniref:glycosyltransferase family 2 protein n=1 Tax=Salinimicrobium sp. GXAS 041 TaxID=3400806 RepID=UPI003C74362B